MFDQLKIKLAIIAGILILIIVLALFGNGSQLINNYKPDDGTSSSTVVDEDAITYNSEVLNEVTGGYSGPPTLVASDDKVFYIPPGYCDGSYLRNFRVIGVNQSTAEFTYDTAGDISDYSGVVVLYGFQTTYREDYGADYDFDYEPYDYNVEYEVVNSFFDDVIVGGGDASDYITSGEDEDEESSDGEISYDLYMPGTITSEENKDVVDDSEFKVATIVMEHEIGKDECKILYCDADSATVGELDEGKFNLVTNLSNDALTVCYNEKMFVYRYDETECTYGSKDVYYYNLNDFFDSVTYKNSLVEAGYCSVKYKATGTITFDNYNNGKMDTWVKNWLKYVDTTNTDSLNGVAYMSNLSGDTADKDDVHSNIIDMEEFLADEIEDAYSGYKKTPSGWFSYKHSTSVTQFGDYTYENLSNDSWTLYTTFTVKLYEKSIYGIFPKGYTSYPTGSITITIVPEYIIDEDYNYTIDDLILTKYDSEEETTAEETAEETVEETAEDTAETAVSTGMAGSVLNGGSVTNITDLLNIISDDLTGGASLDDGSDETTVTVENKYSMVLQLMITPVNGNDEQEEIDPIEDFEQYRQDVLNEVDADTTPDGVDEGELEDYDEDGEVSSDSEETIKSAVSAKYLSFNVNLSQVSETTTGEKINILTITDANELKEEIDSLKEKYLAEYNKNITQYASETKSGSYVIPKDFTVDAIEDFKLQFYQIKVCREAVEAAKVKLAELYAELEKEYENKESNVDSVNDIADKYGVESTEKGDFGYYAEVEDRLLALGDMLTEETKITSEDDLKKLFKTTSEISLMSISSYLGAAATRANSLFGGSYTAYLQYDGNEAASLSEGMTRATAFAAYLKSNSHVSGSVISLLRKINSYIGGTVLSGLTQDDLDDIIYIYEEAEFLYNFADHCSIKSGAGDDGTVSTLNSLLTNLKNNLDYFLDAEASNYIAAVYSSFVARTDSNGVSLLTYLSEMADILYNINNYELVEIPELEAQIAELEEELVSLKENFDKTDFALDFYWQGTAVTGEMLDENLDIYDEITANLDEYMSAYNTLLAVDDYRGSADSVVSNIKALNTDSEINRIIDDMYDAISMDTGAGGYDSYTDDVKYIKSVQNKFYYNISTALNSAANIYGAETETSSSSEDENTNIKLIKEGIKAFYGSMGANTVNARTYTQITADCESIYNSLYDSFTKVSTVIDGEDVTVCDVTAETVLKYVYDYLIDNYGITVLTYVDEEGVERTTTIAKNNESGGNISVEDATEATIDDTSSDGYEQNLYAVYRSFSQVLSYAENLDEIYDNLLGLAIKVFYGSGCLTDEQLALFDSDPTTADPDITSDYNTGFIPAYKICREMPDLIRQVKVYYDTRSQAAAAISTAASKGMTLTLRDDRYYSTLYREKCYQADYLYKLFYNAAKATTDAERQAVVDEYNAKTDWLILDDIEVDKELTSVMKVETETITTTYQKVTWNTALINTDVEKKIESLVTDDAYEMYQMAANFIVIINAERGYVVPMGAQADADVTALNNKIKEEIDQRDIGDIENVAYGTDDDTGYQILLFSSASGWFMIIFKQTETSGGTITIDRNNVLGYYGTYSTGETDDAHFLEYDHTNITGLNQFYSTTIENGFIPYDINLSSSGSGTISPAVEFVETEAENPVSEIAAGSVGVEGSFFNAWTFTSNGKGNVILLGYKKEDMEIVGDGETEEEAATEITTYYNPEEAGEEMEEEEAEEEKSYREIVDSDIYDARLYVYQYDTKAASEETSHTWSEDDYYELEYSKLSDIVANLTGPYGELVKTPVILLEYARVPVIILVYALLAVYCIYLGVKYATSGGDESRHTEAKNHLKWFIIGVLTIHILMGFMYCTYRQLQSWQEDIAVETGTDEEGLKNW